MQLLNMVFNWDWKHIVRIKYDLNTGNQKYSYFSRKLRGYSIQLISIGFKHSGGLKPQENTDYSSSRYFKICKFSYLKTIFLCQVFHTNPTLLAVKYHLFQLWKLTRSYLRCTYSWRKSDILVLNSFKRLLHHLTFYREFKDFWYMKIYKTLVCLYRTTVFLRSL